MNFEITLNKDVFLLKINLVRATADYALDLKKLLFEKIDKENATKIVLDLKMVEFTDSTFLGAIVSGLKKIANNTGDIKIANLQPAVRTMFELTRLYKVFEIYENENDAINSF